MLHRQYGKCRSRRDYKITEQIDIASFPQINCNLIQVIPKNNIWLHATISKSEQILSIHSFIHSHSTNLKLLTDILSIRSVWLQDMIMHFSYSWKCSSGPLQPPPHPPATLPKELMQEQSQWIEEEEEENHCNRKYGFYHRGGFWNVQNAMKIQKNCI